MAALLPELDAEDQRCILGGTATTSIPPNYTGTIPEPIAVTTTVDPYAVTGSMPTATTTSTVPATTTTGSIPEPTGVLYTIEGRDYMLFEKNDGSAYIEYTDENGTRRYSCEIIEDPEIYEYSKGKNEQYRAARDAGGNSSVAYEAGYEGGYDGASWGEIILFNVLSACDEPEQRDFGTYWRLGYSDGKQDKKEGYNSYY